MSEVVAHHRHAVAVLTRVADVEDVGSVPQMSETADVEKLTLVVLVDPGLPSRRVDAVKDDLVRDVESWNGMPVDLEVRCQRLMLTSDNAVELADITRVVEEADVENRVVLVVTEIPRHTEGHPLVAELRPDLGAAIISCPTLGVWRTRRQLRRMMLACIARSMSDVPGRDVEDLDLRWTRWSDSDHGSSCLMHATDSLAPARMVMGMTAANEPLTTATRLSSALAAGAAVGAFGIFYSSIWQMATALSAQRLVAITAIAIVAMTAWLLFSNRLWDRARREPLRRVVALYNLSTVLTLVLCVVALYATLVVLILLTSLLVIDPGFLGTVLGDEPSWRDWVHIAWLAASMGVVAGALGSSFDSDTEVRDLTHGQRERQRLPDPSQD